MKNHPTIPHRLTLAETIREAKELIEAMASDSTSSEEMLSLVEQHARTLRLAAQSAPARDEAALNASWGETLLQGQLVRLSMLLIKRGHQLPDQPMPLADCYSQKGEIVSIAALALGIGRLIDIMEQEWPVSC